ncbi:MAG: UDP-N-acetylmuramoyl-L-alanine--D-glutamate ligase [Rudaea sp.]
MRLSDLEHVRVAIWGFGREGRAALAALRTRFPGKPLTVFGSVGEAPQLNADVNFLNVPPDAATLAQFDIVIKSPGISPYKPPMPEAERAGVRFTSGTASWFADNPDARTICVTGTKGKSTVTALIAHLLRKSGACVALAGNIGLPLLELIDSPRRPDWWAVELSSFQTRDFAGAPTVAVINNVYEEHLDWHGARANYVADKLAIATRAQRLVVAAQPELLERTAAHPQRSVFGADAGWHVRGDAIFCGNTRILTLASLPFPGAHNAHNVCAALAAIDAAALDARSIVEHVASFRALPHRLQTLGVRDGVEYINDSIATTPYATIEALRSLTGRAVTVLVGGFDRGLDWSAFVEYVTEEPPHAIVTMGANGATIAERLRRVSAPAFVLAPVLSMADAVARARALTPAGGVVLLSPGAPSFDQFRDYAERGRQFARLAGFDPDAIGEITGLGIA